MRKTILSSVCAMALLSGLNANALSQSEQIQNKPSTSEQTQNTLNASTPSTSEPSTSQNEQWELQKQNLQSQISTKQSALETLKQDASSMSAQLQSSSEQFEHYQSQVRSKYLEVSHKEGLKLSAQNNLRELKSQQSELESAIALFERNKAGYEAQLKTKQEIYNAAKARYDATAANDKDRIEAFNALANAEYELKRATNSVTSTQASINDKKAKLAANQSEQSRLSAQLPTLESEFLQAKQDYAALKSTRDKALEQLDKLNYDTASKHREVEQAKNEIAKLQNELKQLKITIAVNSEDGKQMVQNMGKIYTSSAKAIAGELVLAATELSSSAEPSKHQQVQEIANQVAAAYLSEQKSQVSSDVLSALNVTINNMNKRLGEVRGMDGDVGAWARVYGGRMSGQGLKFDYYSTQIGADKKSSTNSGDVILGVLAGYDHIGSASGSKAYSVGAYASYVGGDGVFVDAVLKYLHTSYDQSTIKDQNSVLASIEGGYRLGMDGGLYIEPSIELITGYIGKYELKDANTTITASYTPMILKPQIYAGYTSDNASLRAGVGAIVDTKSHKAQITIGDIIKGVNASSSTTIDKNNHGFVSVGGALNLANNLRLNLSVERSFGGKITNDYEINSTIRYVF